jgi:hypothetical protein
VGFLAFNVFATAVWTIGALSAVYCSGANPEYSSTALLLSGLVNAFAAIAFSVWVDPQAAIITTGVIKKERAPEQVYAAALHLGLGNFIGGLLGLAGAARRHLRDHESDGGHRKRRGAHMAGEYLDDRGPQRGPDGPGLDDLRLAGVGGGDAQRGRGAGGLQPVLLDHAALPAVLQSLCWGSTADHLVKANQVEQLEALFRWVLAGASVGSFVGLACCCRRLWKSSTRPLPSD